MTKKLVTEQGGPKVRPEKVVVDQGVKDSQDKVTDTSEEPKKPEG